MVIDTANTIASLIRQTRKHGGGSVSLTGVATPEFGFMVGGAYDSLIAGADVLAPDHEELLTEQILKYVDTRREFAYDPHVFLGGWVDESDGRVYFELSELIYTFGTAKVIGKARNEIAIWDIAKGEEVRLENA